MTEKEAAKETFRELELANFAYPEGHKVDGVDVYKSLDGNWHFLFNEVHCITLRGDGTWDYENQGILS